MAKNSVQIPQMVKGEDQPWQKKKKKRPLCGVQEIWNQITYPATFDLEDSQVYDNCFWKNEKFTWFLKAFNFFFFLVS